MSIDNDTTHDLLYEHLEDVERLETYRPGGYHPVKVYDRFLGHYRVVHKLGHGSYSTTWLAHDERSKSNVAIKICTANSNPKEIDVLLALAGSKYSSLESMGRSMILPILDSFSLQGLNGTHRCYVTLPARVSLSAAKGGSWTGLFQLDVARALAAQVVLAIEYAHSQGVKLYEEYGEPELEPVVLFDGGPLPPNVPTHGIAPIWLAEASEKIPLTEAPILLADFGEAFLPRDETKTESHTPLVVRPPFEPKQSLSFPSDIWSLACTIWSIVAARNLFERFLATEDDMTCEHVDALGILPHGWWINWEAHSKFTDDGNPIGRSLYRSWNDRFEDSVQQPREESGMPRITSDERDALFAMLKSMLSFRPEERPTARQVLESEWMVKWALPEYAKIKDSGT
ncbi:putative srpk [Delphinella strobiligena]|nr:putative srpk [Delphinella strobiligena]